MRNAAFKTASGCNVRATDRTAASPKEGERRKKSSSEEGTTSKQDSAAQSQPRKAIRALTGARELGGGEGPKLGPTATPPYRTPRRTTGTRPRSAAKRGTPQPPHFRTELRRPPPPFSAPPAAPSPPPPVSPIALPPAVAEATVRTLRLRPSLPPVPQPRRRSSPEDPI